MEMNTDKSTERITAVLVDTSAYRHANSDFIGVYSSTLPLFFEAIKEKDVLLLSHPILEREIENHITNSSIYKDHNGLSSLLRKCQKTLEYFDCHNDEYFKRIINLDIKSNTLETFSNHYSKAVRLDYPKPEVVFDQYFAVKPPFSSSKKKAEFPDAFVIQSAKEFLLSHENEILLVVSSDNDWKTAFSDTENVVFCSSLSKAVAMINSIDCILDSQTINELFQTAYKDIQDRVQFSVDCECYDFPEYEFIEDFFTDSVKVKNISDLFDPLKITRSSMLLKSTASLSVAGHGTVFDEDGSVWDSEEREYVFKSYADFCVSNGAAEVECEILLTFDFDDPLNTVQVSKINLNNRGNIEVKADDCDLVPVDSETIERRILIENY